jgi:hypothetical protein
MPIVPIGVQSHFSDKHHLRPRQSANEMRILESSMVLNRGLPTTFLG